LSALSSLALSRSFFHAVVAAFSGGGGFSPPLLGGLSSSFILVGLTPSSSVELSSFFLGRSLPPPLPGDFPLRRSVTVVLPSSSSVCRACQMKKPPAPNPTTARTTRATSHHLPPVWEFTTTISGLAASAATSFAGGRGVFLRAALTPAAGARTG